MADDDSFAPQERASLLRSLGYPKALSVTGGFQVWKKFQVATTAAT